MNLSPFGFSWAVLALAGCASLSPSTKSPVPLAEKVELERYMGDWYVIGIIPNFIEKNAYNSIESYRLDDDGTIATTFQYRKGAFDAPLKTLTPRGFVVPNSHNALWGMRVIWPLKGEYRIAYVATDYSTTIVGRSQLDYVWLMSRRPEMNADESEGFRALIASWGYDVSAFVRVPQRWPEAQPRP